MNGRTQLHQEIKILLDYAPRVDKLLDIGFGDGELSRYFRKKGTKVVAGGININQYKERYATNLKKLENDGIDIVECNVEKMPFEDNSFDGVLASHILEHVNNMGNSLQEIRRVLKDEGWLFIFIPRFDENVVDGHVNTGWNLGQLIYVLAMNGFNVREGKFIHYGYSLCAFCQNRGGIPTFQTLYPLQELVEKNILPEKIIRTMKYPNKSEVAYGFKKGIAIGYNGNFEYLNFPNARKLLREYKSSKQQSFDIVKRVMEKLDCIWKKMV